MITFKIVNSKGINFKSIAFGDKGGNKFPLLNPSAKLFKMYQLFSLNGAYNIGNNTWQNQYHTLYHPKLQYQLGERSPWG